MINVSPVHRSPDTSLVRCSSRHYIYCICYGTRLSYCDLYYTLLPAIGR